jgi:arginine utilization regulatory protein
MIQLFIGVRSDLMQFYRELLDILIKYIEEGIHVIDSNGKTIIYNKAMEGLEGLEGVEVIDKKFLEIFPSLNETTSTLYRVMNTGEPISDKYQNYVNKLGHNITAVNTTVPIKQDGLVVGAVEISRNFTKIIDLYDRITHLREKNNINKVGTLSFENITGYSSNFLKAVENAKKASKSSSTVLICGDTGTGKEVFAKCIHNESNRFNKPFIAVNCAALPEGLLEGILFGTVKGGFTGAVDRPGLFEQSDGGTLLLDEINSMSVALQAKLLRVLQEGYLRRVGDIKDIPVNVRIIATTNEDPQVAINKGALRKDLFYRLNVVNILIPPLRERKEDIPLFIKEFVAKYNESLSKNVWEISNEIYDGFMSYDWPGNVRELKNYIEGAMNMVSGHILKKEFFTPQVQELIFSNNNKTPSYVSYEYDFNVAIDEYMDSVEKSIILRALIQAKQNISEAARLLKLKRQTLQHKMKKYNINN